MSRKGGRRRSRSSRASYKRARKADAERMSRDRDPSDQLLSGSDLLGQLWGNGDPPSADLGAVDAATSRNGQEPGAHGGRQAPARTPAPRRPPAAPPPDHSDPEDH